MSYGEGATHSNARSMTNVFPKASRVALGLNIDKHHQTTKSRYRTASCRPKRETTREAMRFFIYINGYPGVGKLTLAHHLA